jgi:dGTPase
MARPATNSPPPTPAATDPAATDPAATDPAATDPAATDPRHRRFTAQTGNGFVTTRATAVGRCQNRREMGDQLLSSQPQHPQGPVAEAFADRTRAREQRELSPRATPSYPARRLRPEPDCGLRTPFQRDRDRIVHCKAFRRLKSKTQVFVAPAGDHYRTRLTHTLEVTQISRTVARALRLNEDLVEAIGLGHDLGHPPFGHVGEDALDRCLAERFGLSFQHHEHSLRVVDTLERDGFGLNLTAPVRDGIVSHSGRAQDPGTLEGKIVRLMDRVAYINHDIDDALRAGVLSQADLPARPIEILGDTGPNRIDTLVHDLVEQSDASGDIVQGEEVGGAMAELRAFMFERVYLGPAATREHAKIRLVVRSLFDHYCDHPEEIPASIPPGDLARRVTDYVAGMTDRFCIRTFEALSVPVAFAP